MAVSYDGFTYQTQCPVFRHTIPRGETEPQPIALSIVKRYLGENPDKNRTMVDVGAHIGTTMLPYSRLFSRVVGQEPNPENYRNLEVNLRQASNVEAHNQGAWSFSSQGFIRRHGNNSGCYYFDVDPVGDLLVRRLDDEGLTNVDFLKIDTEGSELKVLEGAEQLLRTQHPLVQFESNHLCERLFGIPSSAAGEFLKSIGYQVYTLDDAANPFQYYAKVNN